MNESPKNEASKSETEKLNTNQSADNEMVSNTADETTLSAQAEKKIKGKTSLAVTKKRWITLGVVFAVILALLAGSLIYVVNNQNAVASQVMYMFMPKSYTDHDNGNEIVFYIEKNKDYNPDKDVPLEAYKVYYFDKDGKRVDTYQGHYKTSTKTIYAEIAFLLLARQNINTFKNYAKIVLAVLAVLLAVGAIILWYKLWNKKQDRLEAMERDSVEKDMERQAYLNRQRSNNADSGVKSGKKKKKRKK